MECYSLDLGSIQQVSSLTIRAKGEATVSAVLYSERSDDLWRAEESVLPSLPVLLSAGYVKLAISVPIWARYIDLLGVGIEFILSVVANELTTEPATLVHARAIGLVNGVNKTFASPTNAVGAVLVNGLEQIAGEHYTMIDEKTFELSDAPLASPAPADVVSIRYFQ